MTDPRTKTILVVGDVCLDVVGVPIPKKSPDSGAENWRQTGETRTHFLPGGAMLLAKFVRAIRLSEAPARATDRVQKEIESSGLKDADAELLRQRLLPDALLAVKRDVEDETAGPKPVKPAGIADGKPGALYTDDFLAIAERLSRREIVHSLLGVAPFPKTAKEKEKRRTLRVEKEHGFSGPDGPDKVASLEIQYADTDPIDILVIDDTGNRFRQGHPGNPWPSTVRCKAGSQAPLIVYKLHRPLPGGAQKNMLWDETVKNHEHNRIVIVSVDELRGTGAPISEGLSWERTALEVVWHLLNTPAFAELRECPRLIVRLGLDGAVLWQRREGPLAKSCDAWLVYDPAAIEGTFASTIPGHMVSCGSAFTAALVHSLDAAEPAAFNVLKRRASAVIPEKLPAPERYQKLEQRDGLLLDAIENGLRAARRLLELGYGDPPDDPAEPPRPAYPGVDLFADAKKGPSPFARHPIPIIPGALEPDRSGWRLLDSIFEVWPLLPGAVGLTATGKTKSSDPRDKAALVALRRVPVASYGNLNTRDRTEIENYRSLHRLLCDYLCTANPPRPLSIGVFGPPGAGKSFGVKEVAGSLKGIRGCKEVQTLTFNLSLYQDPNELAGAFHLIRDIALRGKVPLVFFDEFDTSLGNNPLGWLRYFLAPMQDGEFLDRTIPHPIGPAVFVFAGGTCATSAEFKRHPGLDDEQFKAVKGPDFRSRLRATLDIPSLNFLTASEPLKQWGGEDIQPPDTFNPYGPIEAFPCEAAILLRRASILAFNLRSKAPELVLADGSVAIHPGVLRALLRLPRFEYGNRSFEALLDMSHFRGTTEFTPSMLPAPFQTTLHANQDHLSQLVATEYPLPEDARLAIAQTIHEQHRKQKRADPNHNPNDRALKEWDELDPDLKDSNFGQADDIALKLRRAGLWFRKRPGNPSTKQTISANITAKIEATVEALAQAEHDRWSAQKRRQGWIAAADPASAKDDTYLLHNCLFPWDVLTDKQKDLDLEPVRCIPEFLAAAKYEIVVAKP